MVTYRIIKELATLNEGRYLKKLNIVSWNSDPPKLDLREFSPDGRFRRGLTLTDNEARILCTALQNYFGGKGKEACV